MDPTSFLPAWWCRNRHVQTMWGPLIRRGGFPATRERFPTRDGDFVDLDWAAPRAKRNAPLLLILHGLEGSWRSHYVRGLVHLGQAHGWDAVVLNFRSCSGEQNRLRRFYHSGDTADLDAVARALVDRAPASSVVIVGVSLGGNVLLKWLGEQEDEAPKQVIAAGAISVPFYLAPCAAALDRGFERLVYTASFMRSFRRKVRAKARVYPGFVDVAAACRARTFREYDGAITAPLEGFRDAMDYWVRASCGPFLGRVRRPTLVINALDDPFVPPAALPDPSTLSSHVTLELTSRGGHAGFFDGRRPWAISSWAERRVIEFLASRVANVERSASITA